MNSHQANIRKKEEELKAMEHRCTTLYTQIDRMRRHSKPYCSDHAIVRYQERVRLLPVEEVISNLLSSQVKKLYNTLGDGTYPTGEGTTRVVIKSGVIVTVLK